MINIVNTEPIQCKVLKSYLYQDSSAEGYEDGFLVAVRSKQNQALQFSVALAPGSVFTGIPISKITCEEEAILPLDLAQAYDSISDGICYFVMESLRLCKCSVKLNNGQFREGKYLFTIEFNNGGFSRHPEQWKQFHVISTEWGLVAYPQYRIKFTDKALFPLSDGNLPPYRENTTLHIAEK